MKTIVLMGIETYERRFKTVMDFMDSRNLRGAVQQPASPQENDTLNNVLSHMRPGDILVIPEMTVLGDTFSAIIHELIHLFENGISLGVADTNTLIDAKGKKSKEYAGMITFIADLYRKMNSKKTKNALNTARQQGRKLGRPAGISRLDGREVEICEYLKKRVSKSAIARIIGTSRASLTQFIVAKELGTDNFQTGGPLHGRD